jgi:FtsP/CotA-like multicopper oxidase with cupredoxin domain
MISSMIRASALRGAGMAVAAAGLALAPSALVQAAPPVTGIACTTAAAGNPTFTLDATDGYIQLPDGNTMYMWGYALGGGAFQHPGPVLCVTEGETVTVILNNNGTYHINDNVSIMFPGQENVLANGLPVQPEFLGTAGALSSLTSSAPAGGSVTYSFKATRPGTYVYESGTKPQQQVRMGLFGALIVRPAAADQMNDRADSKFTTNETFATGGQALSEEYMVLLSEIEPYQHQAAEAAMTAAHIASPFEFNLNDYHARYWLINGRGFPDSISDNYSPFLPDQPYGALARILPYDPISHPKPGAIRYLNVGTEEFPFHPHGQNGLVIGRDGAALENASAQDLSFEKFAINIGPGQTWDVLFKWFDAESYSTKPAADFPVVIPQVNNQEFGMFYSGSPFLGQKGTLPPGASTLNTCGEYYVISHNHALYQITSWGVNLTGPITYLRVDPPLATQSANNLFCTP